MFFQSHVVAPILLRGVSDNSAGVLKYIVNLFISHNDVFTTIISILKTRMSLSLPCAFCGMWFCICTKLLMLQPDPNISFVQQWNCMDIHRIPSKFSSRKILGYFMVILAMVCLFKSLFFFKRQCFHLYHDE